MRWLAPVWLALALLGGACAPAMAQDRTERVVRLATGSLTGRYFPVGVSVCRTINAERLEHGVRCAAVASGGSVGSIGRLQSGETDLALVQSDAQREAVDGGAAQLRALFGLYPEHLALVARAGEGRAALADLAGARVAAGGENSGAKVVWDRIAALAGLDDVEIVEIGGGSGALTDALCSERIDAFVVVSGLPAGPVQDAALECAITLLEVSGAVAEQVAAETEGAVFAATTPGGIYSGVPQETATLAVEATLLARADLGEDLVYTMLRPLFGNIEALRSFDPVLAGLEPRDMITRGLSAPLHPGAARYYREQGWLAE